MTGTSSPRASASVAAVRGGRAWFAWDLLRHVTHAT
jgi:hypothetical protein